MKSMSGRRQRSDARRSRAAILEATLETLGEHPGATLGDIAAAAGVSRGTLYGHFASRRALIVATFQWMMSEVDRQLAGLDPDLPAPESLDEVVATSWWVLGHCAGMMVAARPEISARELRRLHDEPLARIRTLLVRGRSDGVFRSDQNLQWQTECVYAILQAGASQIREGQLLPPEAAAEMITTVRSVLRAEGAGSAAESTALPARSSGPP